MVSGNDIRQKYLRFFEKRGHKIIPSSPLVPENDPTTLFTGSGMQPMINYLLGAKHPLGTRLVDSQKCFRAQDIEEVGDNRHDTFFEMLGNWSLGDYFKKDQLAWFYEFLTVELNLSKNRLYVSIFEGNDQIGRDIESEQIWQNLGVSKDHIFAYGVKNNWWARNGAVPDTMPVGEPGGPDSEVFYDFGTDLNLHENSSWAGEVCHPNCNCGRFLEIGNSVFMQYQKQSDGSLKELPQKNVDFGGGLERLTAAANNDPDIFKTDLFTPIIASLGKEINFSTRIIADHFKASVFLISDGVLPGNKGQGYFLRRLLRRAIVKLQKLGLENINYFSLIKCIFQIYSQTSYFNNIDINFIKSQITEESQKFQKTLNIGLKKLGTVSAFDLYQSYGFPLEVIEELYQEKKLPFDKKLFDQELQTHQNLSRTASAGMFKGGLADHSEVTTKYHTATHLLHASLRQILGDHVQQKGSNITAERLRFDFSHPDKLSLDKLTQIENLINQKISENIPVTRIEMKKSEALAQGALAFFPEKYPDLTSVYKVGDFSKELCGGPHVASTGEIGRIKIVKEESAGSGIRRIYAQLV